MARSVTPHRSLTPRLISRTLILLQVTELLPVARHYVFSWFLIDFLAVVPIDTIARAATAGQGDTTDSSEYAILSLLKVCSGGTARNSAAQPGAIRAQFSDALSSRPCSKVLRLLRLGRVLNANNLSLTSSGGVLYRFLRLLAGIAMPPAWGDAASPRAAVPPAAALAQAIAALDSAKAAVQLAMNSTAASAGGGGGATAAAAVVVPAPPPAAPPRVDPTLHEPSPRNGGNERVDALLAEAAAPPPASPPAPEPPPPAAAPPPAPAPQPSSSKLATKGEASGGGGAGARGKSPGRDASKASRAKK